MASKTVKVTQTRNSIGREKSQGATLKAMGLGKMHRTVELPDNDATWGMINKVSHLVTVAK